FEDVSNDTKISSVPIVQFTLADGTMKNRPIGVKGWDILQPNRSILCSRAQIPLILAWAIMIQRLKVDLDGIFESGQAYTALSRAVSVDCLEVVNFAESSVKADVASVEFY
ncbi:hypothetical protein F5883DRAFT_367879, partial [Diaporthe sp. PMI_573]